VKNESPSPTPRTNLGGRLWKIAMGALLMVVGSVFVSYLWGAYQRAALMDSWVETPCTILSTSMDDTGRNQKGMPKYTLFVSYEYEFEGKKFEGGRFKRLPSEASDPRSQTVCHVDPKSPNEAVLKKDTKAALYSIWFPCLFVIGGAGMILSALFRK